MSRITCVSLILMSFVGFTACEDEMSYEYRDMVCDSDGCFTCASGVCEMYSCYEHHQCPVGRF